MAHIVLKIVPFLFNDFILLTQFNLLANASMFYKTTVNNKIGTWLSQLDIAK